MFVFGQVQESGTECPQPPSDTPSEVAWFKGPNQPLTQSYLAAAAWDGTVRMWEVMHSALGTDTTSTPTISGINAKVSFDLRTPVLTCCFGNDALYSGNCNKEVTSHNLQTQQSVTVGTHDGPVCSVVCDLSRNILISGSFDKTVKFWDLRSPGQSMTSSLGSPIVKMDLLGSTLGVACVDGKTHIFNLNRLGATPANTVDKSGLFAQPTDIAVLPGEIGFALAGVEGRVTVHCFNDPSPANKSSFSFRCHRSADNLRCNSVNVIAAYPNYTNYLLTAGNDGAIVTWDRVARTRCRDFRSQGSAVSTLKFHSKGTLIAYGCGYNWHRGFDSNEISKSQNKVCIIGTSPEGIKSPMKKK